MADDIGNIDHGVLLKEESLRELEKQNMRYIHFGVSNSAEAAQILKTTFKTQNFHVEDEHNIRLYELSLEIPKVNRAFIEKGIELTESHVCEDTLEDYFKKITGGVGIA